MTCKKPTPEAHKPCARDPRPLMPDWAYVALGAFILLVLCAF